VSHGGNEVVFGVSIAIPPPHADVLSAWRARSGDPQADLVPPHVTLLPPTGASAAQAREIEEHLADASRAVGPFAMHLAGAGTFRPVSQVVFVQVAAGLVECELLEARVRSGPLARALDFPYHPHVTVAQDVDPDALDDTYEGLRDFVARFEVRSFTMYERGTDGTWLPRREYSLQG
jgi:2'-5' RNA ligase